MRVSGHQICSVRVLCILTYLGHSAAHSVIGRWLIAITTGRPAPP
jgi:hypothetical protein